MSIWVRSQEEPTIIHRKIDDMIPLGMWKPGFWRPLTYQHLWTQSLGEACSRSTRVEIFGTLPRPMDDEACLKMGFAPQIAHFKTETTGYCIFRQTHFSAWFPPNVITHSISGWLHSFPISIGFSILARSDALDTACFQRGVWVDSSDPVSVWSPCFSSPDLRNWGYRDSIFSDKPM